MSAPQRFVRLGSAHDPGNLVTVQVGVRDPEYLSLERTANDRVIVRIESGTDESGYFELTAEEAIAVARAIAQGLSQ